jgi:hypothetical protein
MAARHGGPRLAAAAPFLLGDGEALWCVVCEEREM